MKLPPAPEWLLAKLRPPERPKDAPRPDFDDIPDAYGRKALEGEYKKVAGAAAGTRNQALNSAAFSLGQLVGDGLIKRSDAEAVLVAAATANGQLAEDGPASILAVIRSGLEAGIATPRDIKPKRKPPPRTGRPRGKPQLRVVDPEKPHEWAEGDTGDTQGDSPEDSPETEGDSPETESPPPETDASFIFTHAGGLKANSVHNAALMLQTDPGLAGLFAFDAFAGERVVTRKPPWALNGHPASTGLARLSDQDVTGCAAYMERAGLSVSITMLHNAINYVATETHLNRPKETLRTLEWDGGERLSDWLCDYMDAPQTGFVRSVAAKWLIGAVARIVRPGSKVDTMLILEGDQGLKKSTALAALATLDGVEYFTDHLPRIGSKDTALELQGKIIIEIAELDAMHRAEVSQVKAWLSQRTDRFRPPYERTVVERPRQCVFAGTVNPGASGYLNDPTGGRRFWPVTVNGVDLPALKAAVPQLWAEAVHRYRQGESWWLDTEEVLDEAREVQRDRFETDAWASKIDPYLAGKSKVRVSEILAEALSIEPDKWDTAKQKRVGRHLAFVGWKRRKYRDPARGGHPTWYFFAPDEDAVTH